MKIMDDEDGYFGVYAPDEIRANFAPLRRRIFDTSCLGMGLSHEQIFLDPSWIKVIIRGSVLDSDRTDEIREEAEELGALGTFDPRDELQPLFDILIEDGIDEIIHMRPWGKEEEQDAVDIYGFTSILTRHLDQDGRQKIVEMLWQVTFADGIVHEFENNLVWRSAELLGVSTRDRIR